MFARPGKQPDTTDNTQETEEEVLDLKLVMGGKANEAPAQAAAPVEQPQSPITAHNPAEQIANEIYGTMIGEDTTITGNLVSPQEILVAGEVQGDITCRRLIVNSAARIHGSIIADEAIIDGTVQGPIRALRVTLQANCHVQGHIFYQSIAMEKGADFEGVARQSDKPKQFDHTAPAMPEMTETAPEPRTAAPEARPAPAAPVAVAAPQPQAPAAPLAQAAPKMATYQAVRPAPSGYRPVPRQAAPQSPPTLRKAS